MFSLNMGQKSQSVHYQDCNPTCWHLNYGTLLVLSSNKTTQQENWNPSVDPLPIMSGNPSQSSFSLQLCFYLCKCRTKNQTAALYNKSKDGYGMGENKLKPYLYRKYKQQWQSGTLKCPS